MQQELPTKHYQTLSQPIYFLPKQISAEFQDRLWKIDRLKCRYEIFTLSMPPEGEEMKSQAYYVIKVLYQHNLLSFNYLNYRFPWALRQPPCLLLTLSLIVLHYLTLLVI